MSESGRGGDAPGVGEPPTESGPAQPAPVDSKPEASAPAPAPSDEPDSIGISSLSLVDKDEGKEPIAPTTPTTADAATAGTDSEHSSVQGKEKEEGAAAQEKPRQVIAVSVSKGPSAFFNLARKFLVTDESVDLSALEGAIVSAVDAAHLLERAKIAKIIRIQTSYVAVEPKKKREHGPASGGGEASTQTKSGSTMASTGTPSRQAQAVDSSQPAPQDGPGSSRLPVLPTSPPKPPPMRRARIVITVKRTADYEKWLEDNPIQDTHAGHDDDHI